MSLLHSSQVDTAASLPVWWKEYRDDALTSAFGDQELLLHQTNLEREQTTRAQWVSVVRVILSFLHPEFETKPSSNGDDDPHDLVQDLLVDSRASADPPSSTWLRVPSKVDLCKSFQQVTNESSKFLCGNKKTMHQEEDSVLSTVVLFREAGAKELIHKKVVDDTIKLCIVLDLSDERKGRLAMYYSTKHFEDLLVTTMAETIHQLIECLNNSPSTTKIAAMQLLPPRTRQQIMQWSCPRPTIEGYSHRLMHSTFVEHAIQRPDKIAVVCDGKSMSYGFMRHESNRIAKLLQSLGVQPDSRVGLFMDRSCFIPLGHLSILRAGGAFVTIGVDHPRDRVLDIINDANIKVLVSMSSMQKKLEDLRLDSSLEVVYVDVDTRLNQYDGTEDVTSNVGVHNLAYLIYTSGTTGRPKGVMIEHRNFSAFVESIVQQLTLGPDEVFSCLLENTFDVNVGDTWMCFHVGGRLVVFTRPTVISMPSMCELVTKEKVTWMSFTPTLLYLFVEYATVYKQDFSKLRLVHVVGEALNHHAMRPWVETYKSSTIMNGYGPSETTVIGSYELITDLAQCDQPKGSCIGTPFPLYHLYIVNKSGMLVPPGVPGELWIGGPAVGRGYLNRQELTSEKFVQDPFDTDQQNRVYKSGDLCSWREDGAITFHCRVDHQVKLRGYRIELDEIENVIKKVPDVKQVVVCLRTPNDNAHLVGYVTPGDIDIKVVREACRAHLPPYMIPSGIIALDKFPLSSNGKVNRTALPELIRASSEACSCSQAVTEIQKLLVKYVAMELHLEESTVDLQKSFIAHAGNSLSAVRVGFHLSKAGFDIPAFMIANCASLAELETLMMASDRCESVIPASKLRASGILHKPLVCSFTQEHYLTLGAHSELDERYNLLHVFKISGPFNLELFQRSMKGLINRHEILRTTFLKDKAFEFKQQIHEAIELDFAVDLKTFSGRAQESLQALAANASRPLEMFNGKPLRVEIHQVAHQVHHVLLILHHTTHDGYSVNLLNDELWRLYDLLNRGEAPSALAPPLIQYYDYAEWQHEQYSSGKWDDHETYWRNHLSGAKPLAYPYKPFHQEELATVRPLESKVYFEIPAHHAEALREKAKQKQLTRYSVMLSLMKMALASFCSQEDIAVVGVEACRHQSNVEKCFGVFANDVLLRTKIDLAVSYDRILDAVAGTIKGMRQHQAFPYVLSMRSTGKGFPNALEKCYFVYQEGLDTNMPDVHQLQIETLELHGVQASPQAELYVEVAPHATGDGSFAGSIAYDIRLFDRDQIETLANCVTLLGAWVATTNWQELAQQSPQWFLSQPA